MTSAHRSSDSAHRSEPAELRTEVFFVKTSDTQDAVIVSFVDSDTNDVEGIYLYEPGVDPVELTTAGVSGVANEFEYATVEGVDLNGTEFEWPGDGMVTRAERDADVENAVQDHANLQQAYDVLREQAQALVDAAERVHRDHPDGWLLCGNPVCEAARSVEL